jgi:hypothetical protein
MQGVGTKPATIRWTTLFISASRIVACNPLLDFVPEILREPCSPTSVAALYDGCALVNKLTEFI